MSNGRYTGLNRRTTEITTEDLLTLRVALAQQMSDLGDQLEHMGTDYEAVVRELRRRSREK